MRNGVSRSQVQAFHVDGVNAVELRLGDVEHRLIAVRRSRIVDDRCQPAESGQCKIDQAFDVCVDRNIAGEKLRDAARADDGVDRFAAMRLMNVVDDDFRALGGESRGDAAPEPGAGAGNDRDLIGEPHC